MGIPIPKFSAYGPLFREYAAVAEQGTLAPKLARSMKRALEGADKQAQAMQRSVSRHLDALPDQAAGAEFIARMDDASSTMRSLIDDIPNGKPKHFDGTQLSARLNAVADAFTAADEIVHAGRGISVPQLPSAAAADAARGARLLDPDAAIASLRLTDDQASTIAKRPWLGEALTRVLGSRPVQHLSRVKVIGAEHVPREGGVVIAATHTGASDIVNTLFGHGRTPRIMAHAGLMKNPVSRAVLEAGGAFPVQPGNSRGGLTTMEALLHKGEAVKIYAEGMLPRVDRLGPAREGAALTAIRAGKPVVVVGEYGTRPAAQYGESVLRHWTHRGGRGAIAYSEPIPTAHLDPKNRDHITALAARIGDEQERLREVARAAIGH